jgi:type III restriction enzyme
VRTIYDATVKEFCTQSIDIPRITIQPKGEVTSGFRDFDLETRNLTLRPADQKIQIQELSSGRMEIVDADGVRVLYDSVENILVNEMMNFPEIDYDSCSQLLFKLSRQAIEKFRSYLNEEEVRNVIAHNKRDIASLIYSQMMEHFYYEAPDFEEPIIDVKAFTRIEPHNYTKYTADSIHDLRDTIEPAQVIPSKIFTGFTKACHKEYKFSSKPEKDFATILENDKEVLKWMRPAPNQFRIYYRHNSKQYRPDFVVETADVIHLVEIKREQDIEDTDVQDKARAALEYCKHATQFTKRHGGKPWVYSLIPDSEVRFNVSLTSVSKRFSVT